MTTTIKRCVRCFMRYWRSATAAISAGILCGIALRIIGVSHRWQWWTESPNDLGALLAVGVILSMSAVLSWGQRQDGTWRGWLIGSGTVTGLASLIGLIGSCSRGGIIAAVVGLAAFIVTLHGRSRLAAIFVLISLIVATSTAPRIGGRFATAPKNDGSIACRIALINASTMMIADKPAGWGSGQFGNICEQWYLDRYRGVHLWHPLNDALWLGCEHGFAAMATFLALTLATIGGLFERGRNGNPMAAGLMAALVSLLVAGFFTGLLRPGGICGSFGTIASLALAVLLHPRYFSRRAWPWMLTGTLTGLLLAGGLWGWGMLRVASLPYLPTPPSAATQAPSVLPRLRTALACVVVVRADDDQDNDICRYVLRSLATAGFSATCLPMADLTTWSGRNRDHLLLVLRGAILDAPIPQGTRGAVLLDPDMHRILGLTPKCPILLIRGSEETELPIGFLEELRRLDKRNDVITAPMPYCWPRFIGRIHPQIIEWMRTVSDSMIPPTS